MCSRVFYHTTKDPNHKTRNSFGRALLSFSRRGGGNRASRDASASFIYLLRVHVAVRANLPVEMRAPCARHAIYSRLARSLSLTRPVFWQESQHVQRQRWQALFQQRKAHAHEHIMKSTRARRSSLSRLRRHDVTRCIGLAPLGFGDAHVDEYSPCIPCAWRFV